LTPSSRSSRFPYTTLFRSLELGGELVVLVAPAVRAQQLGEAVDLLEREAECLPRLAHRAPRTVGDHRRRHGGAALAVAAVDVLEDRKSTRLNSSHGSISYA